MKRFFVTAAIIIICFLLQTTVCQYFAVVGKVPNLLLIVVASFAYMRGRKVGMYVGFSAGILEDFVYGDLIGMNALLLVVVGFIVGMCSEIYYRDELSVPIILIALSDFSYNFAFYVINFLLRGRFQVFYYIWHIILPEVVYTLLVSIFMYRLLYGLNLRIEKHEEFEEGL
ncbi:MAG: rod shape-determining protein MreD [Lachnospiraceae bacterium]|jgi:rod shape-determining protein MreD|nr:rod shape-determining protein MreD [Lachnospiraceae bacterium]MCR4803886.1 rod shape-determining protein MreD [Lachnospiraceae bacterium]